MRIFFLILIFFHFHSVFAETITVDKKGKHTTIQSAIAASKDGDVIVVEPGIYTEGEIKIAKEIKLTGNKAVIDGQLKSQIITVYANNVVIEGFEIRNSGFSSSYDWAAIKIIKASHVIIRNNKFTNNSFGIYLQNARQCSILHNSIISNSKDEMLSGNAIHCWKSSEITIEKNFVSGHRDGIYFEFVTNSVIKNNESFKNVRYGLHFMFSHNNTYTNNTFKNNGAGIAVMYSKGITMTGNRFLENWGSAAYGILMKDISDSHVYSNIFEKNTIGVYMDGSSRVLLENNQFLSNGWAMRVQSSCDDNTIKQNNFQGNSFDIGSNGTMQLNDFTHNYWDKYEGYDLNKDGIGDIPYRPVSMYSMVIEQSPPALMLFRSFLVNILDKTEKVLPAIIPENLIDNQPSMKRFDL